MKKQCAIQEGNVISYVSCPVCGTEMVPASDNNPHNLYETKYSCRNHDCGIELKEQN